MYIILLILQLLFILPFSIYAGLSISKALRGFSYVFKKSHFYISLALLLSTALALMVDQLGILSLSVFITYTFFLCLIVFYKKVETIKKNNIIIIFKIFLYLIPVIELVLINSLLFSTLNFAYTPTNNIPGPITDLIPTYNLESRVMPLVTLLLLASSVTQLITYLIDQVIDRLYKGRHDNKVH